jgi:hypothetical protein
MFEDSRVGMPTKAVRCLLQMHLMRGVSKGPKGAEPEMPLPTIAIRFFSIS